MKTIINGVWRVPVRMLTHVMYCMPPAHVSDVKQSGFRTTLDISFFKLLLQVVAKVLQTKIK